MGAQPEARSIFGGSWVAGRCAIYMIMRPSKDSKSRRLADVTYFIPRIQRLRLLVRLKHQHPVKPQNHGMRAAAKFPPSWREARLVRA